MSAIKIALRQSQRNGKRKTSEAEVSPDSKCPICLDKFNNMSHLDTCLHKFCFRCIHEWSKNKAECPLCKQPFNSIYHSIKSEQDYKKYDLKPLENGSFGTFWGVRFRYRTTLTGVHRQLQRRTSPPPDNGVMFEGSANPQQLDGRYSRRMMMRLAANRRAESEGRAVQSVREQEMINFRRDLYRRGVRVRNVRDGGRSRDTSAEFYRRYPACLHRLIPWLKRELVVLYGAHGSLVNIVQHIIMSRITRYDMEDGAIQEELRPFLQGRTEHFLHEFISFAKSPFNMEAYDHHATYDIPAPSSNEDSSTNSSVIAISEDEQNSVELDPPGDSMSTLSHSLWDDETPGPSYSTTVEQSRTERLSVPDTDSDTSVENEMGECGASPQRMSPHIQTDSTQDKDNNDDSDSDDCLIIGFVKPTSDRTPELVQLSSDSEESDDEDTKEVPPLPQHIRFTSLSPQSSQRGDPGDPVGRRQSKDVAKKSNSKERCSSSSSSKSKTSSKAERKSRHHRDSRYHRRRSRERQQSRNRDQRSRRSRSGDHRPSSRSPLISRRGGSTLTRDNKHLYSSSRGTDADFSHNPQAYSYHSQSYSRYNQQRGDTGIYREKRSYYHSSHNYPERYSYSHSRSHSRESSRRDRAFRHSRSGTYSSSRSPSTKTSLQEKPGGKRKYKTRHLEDSSKNSLSKSHSEADSATLTKHRKRSKEKRPKKSKESRSLSVEIVNDENSSERGKRHHKKKKKHKKKSKRHKSKERTEKRSPAVITIDSDSDANGDVTQGSSTNEDNLISSTTDDPADSNPLQSLL